MNKFYCAFLSIILGGIVSNAHALNAQCLADIGSDNATFVSPMHTEVLSGQLPTQENVDANNSKMFGLVGANIELKCLNGQPNLNDFQAIAESKAFIIPFTYTNNEKYLLQVDTEKLFDYINLPTGFIVTNNRNYKPGQIIKKSDMPTDYWFDGDCSDHYVRINISNDAAINVAGQKAFGEYGGSKNEFFLDFPVGKNCRSFPGLVLGDFGGLGAEEKIVAYQNYVSAQKAAQSFADALQSSSCSNQNLAVYLVALETTPVAQGGTEGVVIGAGIGGAAAGAITVALASNPAGWVIGAVGAVVGGVVAGVSALFYKELTPIDQVVVMKGPYIIR